jgi:hypothetical protein
MRDDAVTPVLATIMMLALMATLIPGAILMRDAFSAEMEAHREAAEHAAWCARNPDIGPPDCASRAPMRGYECAEVESGVWVCTRTLAANDTAKPHPPAKETPLPDGTDPLL